MADAAAEVRAFVRDAVSAPPDLAGRGASPFINMRLNTGR